MDVYVITITNTQTKEVEQFGGTYWNVEEAVTAAKEYADDCEWKGECSITIDRALVTFEY